MNKLQYIIIALVSVCLICLMIFPKMYAQDKEMKEAGLIATEITNENVTSNMTELTQPDGAASEAYTSATASDTENTSVSEEIQEEVNSSKAILPNRVLTGYWHNFDNGSKCLKISDVPDSYNLIAIAFADATDKSGELKFNLDQDLSNKLGGYSKEEFIKDIENASKKGQKVIISVGGEKGTVSVADEISAERFAESAYEIITEYGFDGIDIDLENGLNAEFMEKALRKLYEKTDENLIITMAPQTIDMQSVQGSYFSLALKIKDILTIVNMQYYNSGSMAGQDGWIYSQGSVDFLTALAAIQLEGGLRADQVGIGLPAATQAAGGGYLDPSIAVEAIKSLANGTKADRYVPVKAYPEIRGIMTWSVNWDATNEYKFADTIQEGLKKLPKVETEATAKESDSTESKVIESNSTEPITTTAAEGLNDWQNSHTYNIGDEVNYNGKSYCCIQQHTSLIGWEPQNAPSLWRGK